jgi:magnesium transporter
MADDVLGDEEEGLDERRVEAVLDAVDARDAARLTALLDPLHPADIADLLEQVSEEKRNALLSLLGREIDGEILSELSDSIREEVIDALPPEVVAEAVRDLDTDDVVDILEDLEAPAQAVILSALESADRVAVERALSYPEYSAGRLMQREVVVAPEHWTVGEMIDHLRSAEWLPDQFYHVILVDPRMKPVAYVTLGRLLSSRREIKLKDIAEDSFRTVSATEPEADVAYLFNQYHLISCPVVDESDRLVGVITIDDAMNVLDEEHEEDILRMAGVGDEASLSDTVIEAAKGRALWLGVNLLTAILASVVISFFAKTINQMVALAVLMPIVASMGGNAGTQSMTVAVRAIATRDLTARNAARVIRREVAVGAVNGLVFGILMAVVTALWFGVPVLAYVIGLAMLLTLMAAAFGGIVIPMALERLKIDPALASGPFVTTVTDVVGFFAFLGLASWMLM